MTRVLSEPGFLVFAAVGIFVVLILGALRGAYAQLAFVLLATSVIWATFLPDVQPEINTPKGQWEIRLRTDARRMIYPLRCEYKDGRVSGEIVNIGTETARVVAELSDPDMTYRFLVSPLVPGWPARWEIQMENQRPWREAGRSIKSDGLDANKTCRLKIVAAEWVEVSEEPQS